MEELVNRWRGRRVFLTGHTGFKGSWLALWLSGLGADIRGYAFDPAMEPNIFTEVKVAQHLDDVRGDVADAPTLQRAMSDFGPEVVFHLAAQPLVRRSYADPVGTYVTNVLGTVNVLEAVRHTPSVRAAVCITTDKCYENREWVWPYREADPLGGFDPYSSSKACAEIVTAAYRNSFFSGDGPQEHRVGVATARAGNVIGGGDWSEDRLIPDLMMGFRAAKTVRIRRPGSIRPWQHVLEPLSGYILLAEQLLAENGSCASAFNFGPTDDDSWTVERIADYVASAWGEGAAWVRDPEIGAHEAGILRLDSSKARAQLGWHPRLTTETSLEWTVAWYREWDKGADMQEFTYRQIGEYQKLSG